MKIVIPTYRRVGTQHTYKAVKDTGFDIVMVCDEEDRALFERFKNVKNAQLLTSPAGITIAQKRKFILEHPEFQGEKIVMFDDDLRFSVRIEEGSSKLRQATTDDLTEHLTELEQQLDHFVHAGWSARQGNNNLLKQFKGARWGYNYRMMYSLGYRVTDVAHNCELGRIEHREDMDYTLQLLSKGFQNVVSQAIAVDQFTGYAAAGGASLERTMEASNADADRLAELHPGLVKVVEKEYRGSINRREVICYWKKAYARWAKEYACEL